MYLVCFLAQALFAWYTLSQDDYDYEPFVEPRFYDEDNPRKGAGINLPNRGWLNSNFSKWEPGDNGNIPLGGFVGGWSYHDRAIYIATVLVGGKWQPARLVDGEECAKAYTNGNDRCYPTYKILVGFGYQWINTIASDKKKYGVSPSNQNFFCRKFLFSRNESKKYDAIGQIAYVRDGDRCMISYQQAFYSDIDDPWQHNKFWDYQKLIGNEA